MGVFYKKIGTRPSGSETISLSDSSINQSSWSTSNRWRIVDRGILSPTDSTSYRCQAFENLLPGHIHDQGRFQSTTRPDMSLYLPIADISDEVTATVPVLPTNLGRLIRGSI